MTRSGGLRSAVADDRAYECIDFQWPRDFPIYRNRLSHISTTRYASGLITTVRGKHAIMKRYAKFTVFGLVTLAVASCIAWIFSNRIRIERGERERHFVSVHFLAIAAMKEFHDDEPTPENIDDLLERSGGGPGLLLLKPFDDGLTYRAVGKGFKLAEPHRRLTSLFRRDRLVASDHEWPHWEVSGAYAWKFPGQTIPSNWLRTEAEPQR